MRYLLAVGVLAALTACSSDDSDNSGGDELTSLTTAPVPACSEVYAEGRPTADVLAETQCMDGDVLMMVVIGSFDCPDGRTLNWNDDGWGYTDGSWAHHTRADGQLVPPQADYDACSG
jgi:hypothetical protein